MERKLNWVLNKPGCCLTDELDDVGVIEVLHVGCFPQTLLNITGGVHIRCAQQHNITTQHNPLGDTHTCSRTLTHTH